MKPLRPSFRRKKRWILVRFLEGRPQNPKSWVVKKLKRILGSWGYAAAVIKVKEENGLLLIAVDRDWVDIVRGAIVFGEDEFIPVTVVSGTIEALKRKNFITVRG